MKSLDEDITSDALFNSITQDQSMNLEYLLQQQVTKSIKQAMGVMLKKMDMLITHKV